jgi:hypothetical protein
MSFVSIPQHFALYLNQQHSSQVKAAATEVFDMSLIQYIRPLLELGTCKEYIMARKTTTPRTKKTTASTLSAPAPEVVQNEIVEEVRTAAPTEGRETPKNGKSAVVASVNLEEEIRLRAYELYLQRRTTSGGGYGDQNQDWLIAEREVRMRHGGRPQHTA